MSADVTSSYRAARDALLAWRGQHEQAVAGFRWPHPGDRFSWAVDWFDAIARGNGRPALTIVGDGPDGPDGAGTAVTWSFDEMARRSDQVAAYLRGHGLGKGESVLVMLGNQVELWDVLLAVMKLGAVAMPTTTAAGPADLADRVERGAARFVVADAADYTRVAVPRGGQVPSGWEDLHAAYRREGMPCEHPGTRPADRLLLYFTSGTTSKPKLVEHTQVSYPVGHLTTMYWLGLRPG